MGTTVYKFFFVLSIIINFADIIVMSLRIEEHESVKKSLAKDYQFLCVLWYSLDVK